jgi:hypothetical protein
MPKYVLAYYGGSMPDDPAQQEQVMTAWMNWFGGLGESIVDAGAPFAASSAIASDRSSARPGQGGLTGYSIISADSLDDAGAKAAGCPVLDAGGTIDVYETAPIG